jgi:hypothetical protein
MPYLCTSDPSSLDETPLCVAVEDPATLGNTLRAVLLGAYDDCL